MFRDRHAALMIMVGTERAVAEVLRQFVPHQDLADAVALVDSHLERIEDVLRTHGSEGTDAHDEWLDSAEQRWEFYTAELRRLEDRVSGYVTSPR